MPRFESFKNISQGIFYWIIITVICLLAVWIIISGIGNIVLNNQAKAAQPPAIEKARYAFFINATNESIFTSHYEIKSHSNNPVYILHGYYEIKNKKYYWHDSDLTLDEFYFGKILLVDRTEGRK
jgi:hypothetical protein